VSADEIEGDVYLERGDVHRWEGYEFGVGGI
jgi:hypothetical protein